MWLTASDIVKREFVHFYDKLFKTDRLWANMANREKDDLVIDLTKHNIRVTENFNYAGEEYPVIVVSAQGGQLVMNDFHEMGKQHSHIQNLGSLSTGHVILGTSPDHYRELAVRFTPEFDFGMEEVSISAMSYPGASQGNIDVNFYRGGADPSSGSLLSSGSISGFSSNNEIITQPVGPTDKIPMVSSNNYWTTFTTDDTSGYYLFTDDDVPGQAYAVKEDSGEWTVYEGKSLVGSVRANSSTVLSGGVRIPISVQIAAKDAVTVDRIFDICLLFTELTKAIPYEPFNRHRIKLGQISFAGDSAPTQYSNQILFRRELTLQVTAAWTYNVDADLLRDLEFSLSTF